MLGRRDVTAAETLSVLVELRRAAVHPLEDVEALTAAQEKADRLLEEAGVEVWED